MQPQRPITHACPLPHQMPQPPQLVGSLSGSTQTPAAQASQPVDATIGIGVMCGLAAAMTGFPIVLSVIGRKFPPETRSFYLGVASAGGASGQLLFVPLGQHFISEYGWVAAFTYLALIVGMIAIQASVVAVAWKN